MKSKQFKRVAGQSFALTTVATVVTALFSPVHAQPAANALPTGAQVVHGSAAINTIGASMQIQQNSAKLITNWQNFDIGSAAKVEFVQPSAASVALNRVTGSDAASQIFGVLNANGRVFLVNPNGILFGATARIDAGALVASTLNIRDQDFLSGQYQFDLNNPVGQVKNFGELVAKQGGFVALMGAQVDNAGRVVATGGQAALAAGQSVRMQIGETGLLGMDVVAGQANTQVSNSGAVIAHGGNVLMSAQSAAGLMSGAVNLTGLVQASRIDGQGGHVRLDGGDVTVTGTGRIEATGQGTDVTLWAERNTRMDGTINALGGKVDTSSKGELGIRGTVNAPEWVLDPLTLTVVNTVPSSGNDINVDFFVAASSIQNYLNGGANPGNTTQGVPATVVVGFNDTAPRTLSLLATNQININADISKTAGGDATLVMGTQGGGNAVNITVNNPISSIAGRLNLQFGASPSDNLGRATINAPLATNGGTVTFNKDAVLAHATPISTKITENSSAQSGSIIFEKNAFLAAPGYAVSLDTQGPQSGGSYTGKGGNIQFKADILSAQPTNLPQYAQALTLDTTGYNSAAPLTGPGNIILGTSATNVVGGSNLSAGSVNALKSLTLLGDTVIDLNASTVNIVSSNGDVITGSSRLGTPTLQLNADNTTINVFGDRQGNLAGNVAGYTDYVQSTFDIAGGKTTAQTLTVNSDRAIKMVNRSITAGGAGGLDVNLNPNQGNGSGVGGVAMTNASVNTRGGDFIVAGAEGNGGDVQLLTDGFYASNSQIRTEGGALRITAEAPTDTAAGSAIRLTGASTVLSSGAGNMTLVGSVNNFAGSGNKDAVVIGEGGNARVTLTATTGEISITGNASGVGSGDLVTGGSRYNGVVISSKALIETTGVGAGNITIVGTGGGGDKVFIAENHGVRFADADTSVVSTTGNIAIVGASGGKTKGTSGTNSFGIYAEGQNIYVGSGSGAYETSGTNIGLLKQAGPTATGHVTFAADSMQFVNTSASHMKAASKGELRIHTLNAGTAIEIGATTGELATAQNSPTQYLGSNWFNGTPNAIFQPGFRDVVIGNARSGVDHENAEVATVGSTSTMKVTAATTFRDNLVLDMSGTGGRFELGANAPLTVSASAVGTQGKPNSDGRSLTIQTQAGATATQSLLTVDQLQILGSGPQNFNRADGHQINTLAARLTAGDLTLNNNQDLTVGSVSVFGGQNDLPVAHNQKNTWMDTVARGAKGPGARTELVGASTTVPTVGIATPGNVVLNSENAHLTQTAAGGIRANQLTATAATYVDFFKADGVGTQFEANNVVHLAGVSNKGDFAWKDINGFNVERLSTLSTQGVIARPDGAQGHTIDLQALSGDITQSASLQAQNLRAQAQNNVTLSNVGNLIDNISGQATVGSFAYTDADSLRVDSTKATRSAGVATDGVTAAVTIDLRSVDGALSQTSAGRLQSANLHARAATGVVWDTATNNNVTNISGSVTGVGDFVYKDTTGLTVGTVAGVAGLTVAQGNVSLVSGGVLNQTESGVIETRGLRALATSSVDLDSAVNKVQTLAGQSTADNFVFKNAGGFLVGTVKADADRVGSEGISAANQVDLQANASNIAQSAAGGITGASLRAVAPGGVWLATADDNNVAQIAGQASAGHFAFKDSVGDLNVNVAGVRTISNGVSARDTVDLNVVGGALSQGQSITGNALRAQASGHVTLSNANNHVNLLAGRSTSGDFSYVDSGSVSVATIAAAQDGQVLTAGIQATSAGKTVHLVTANRLDQEAGASVKAPNALLNAAVVNLNERNNEVSVLAGRSDGNFTFYNTSDLSVGTVKTAAGVDRRAPASTALAKVDIQTRGNLTLNAQVTGRAEGNEALDEAVVLRAEKRFLNETSLRDQAIVAHDGRWLVYDNNPLLLNKDMNGLASETFNVTSDRDFLLINTRFQDYPPAAVYARGNGYITTAQALNPEDVTRVTQGHQSTALGQQTREVTPDQIERMSKMNQLTGVTPSVFTSPRGSFAMISSSTAVPLRVAVPMGRAFKLDLRDLVGQGRLSSIAAADGSATPWVSAAGQAELIGTAPRATELVLSITDPGQTQPRRIRLQLQAL